MIIRKIGVMSLLAALLSVGTAVNTTGANAQSVSRAKVSASYFCINNPGAASCQKPAGQGSVAAANQAIAAAIAAINKANACTRSSSAAACQALIQAAKQAEVNATALSRAAGITPPTFPGTGGGGTAPGSGTSAAVGGVVTHGGLPMAVSGTTGVVSGSTGVHTLPATGGGAPASPNSPLFALLLAAMMLMLGGVAVRAGSNR